jgi:DNA-binding NtrC family response regulator
MDCSILVVDDETDFLESVKRCLIMSGYRNFRLIFDPMEVVRLLESGETYDIALLDITLPGMSGTDLLERIKSSSPATGCIMVTAINEVEMAERCMEKGAYDYLVKPFSGEDLVLRIQRALERKRCLLDSSVSER